MQGSRPRGFAEQPLHMVSWNVENIVPRLGRLSTDLERLAGPAVLCLQEVRLRAHDEEAISRLRAALPDHRCFFSLCSDPKNVRFRGGRAHGVTTYVRSDIEARELSHPRWDLEGRVVITELVRYRLAIVNVYGVNGTNRPYFDHDLGGVRGDRHDFKRRFNKCLMDHCAALERKGLSLVLLGDFNISRTAADTYPRLRTELPHSLARKEFNEVFMPTLDVLDAFRELHPDARKYTWFNPRTPPGRLDAARVDFVLVSAALLDRVVEADILDAPDVRGTSDHAPVYVKLDLKHTSDG